MQTNILIYALFKGTVSGDFLFEVFFRNHLPPSPSQGARWQIIGTISGCRYLKVNLKAKIYIYVNPKVFKQNY
jgi:hypothetical protein